MELYRDPPEEDEEKGEQQWEGADTSVAALTRGNEPSAAAAAAQVNGEDVAAWALRLLEADSWKSRATVALAGHGKK